MNVNPMTVATLDATSISVKIFGPTAIPITNTSILGAFTKVMGLIKFDSLVEPIRENFVEPIGDKNIEAAKKDMNEFE